MLNPAIVPPKQLLFEPLFEELLFFAQNFALSSKAAAFPVLLSYLASSKGLIIWIALHKIFGC